MRVDHLSDSMTLCLADDQLISLVSRSATQVSCETGIVWLTVEGEVRDRILRAGEREALPPERLVVVQALATARVAVAVA